MKKPNTRVRRNGDSKPALIQVLETAESLAESCPMIKEFIWGESLPFPDWLWNRLPLILKMSRENLVGFETLIWAYSKQLKGSHPVTIGWKVYDLTKKERRDFGRMVADWAGVVTWLRCDERLFPRRTTIIRAIPPASNLN